MSLINTTSTYTSAPQVQAITPPNAVAKYREQLQEFASYFDDTDKFKKLSMEVYLTINYQTASWHDPSNSFLTNKAVIECTGIILTTPFPHLIDWYKQTCNVNAILLTHFLYQKGCLQLPYQNFLGPDTEQARSVVTRPLSMSRILCTASAQSASHEFIIINLNPAVFFVQADIYRQLRMGQEGSVIEGTQEDLCRLFSNDQATFEKLFALSPFKSAHLQIEQLHHYSLV